MVTTSVVIVIIIQLYSVQNQFHLNVVSLNYIRLLFLVALSHHGTANHISCIQGLSSLGVTTLYHDNRLYWLHIGVED